MFHSNIFPSNITCFKKAQPEKAPFPISIIEFGIITLVRLSQPKKAPSPISVTEFGMVILVKLEHL